MGSTQTVTATVSSLSPAQDRALDLMLNHGYYAQEALLLVTQEQVPGYARLNRANLQQLASRHGYQRRNFDASKYVPWKLERKDWSAYYAKGLRAYGKMRELGRDAVAQGSRDLADAMIASLTEEQKVITYTPEGGFDRVDRRWRTLECGIKVPVDEGWIRDPRIDNEGNPI